MKRHEIKHILSTCSALEERIGCNDVNEAIGKMKKNKSPGLDHLTSEHFVYASDRIIVVLLTIFFNAMLMHGHLSKEFTDTMIIPIIKYKKGLITDPDNYRPIAITGVASKIMETVILQRLQVYIYIQRIISSVINLSTQQKCASLL